MAYASRTGTKRNLDALRDAGWGLLISAAGVHRSEGFDRIMIDNGAWSAHTQGQPWQEGPFLALLDLYASVADWVVLPDIVGGGAASLALSLAWLERLRALPLLLPVQDGMTADDVAPYLGPRLGIFVGGSTEWKLATMREWGTVARARGAHLHVARVNSARRIRLCWDAGADSFDGSGPSRFAECLPRLDRARRQLNLFGGLNVQA